MPGKNSIRRFEMRGLREMIPKKYIIAGLGKANSRFGQAMHASWQKFCPDYLIVEWNEKILI